MRRVALALIMVGLLVLHAAGCGGDKSGDTGKPDKEKRADLVFGESDTGITVKAGERFVIELDSNPTTGFGWRLDGALDGAVVENLGSEYVAEEYEKGLLGAGGVELWSFRAVAPGTANISLIYVRSFEDEPQPERTASFLVNVQ